MRGRRIGVSAVAAAVMAVLVTAAGAARAAPGPLGDPTRPVKVVVLGGSVSAYGQGGYAQWIPAVCAKVDLVNRAKEKLNAWELRERFKHEVMKDASLGLKARVRDGAEVWLVFLGGLNSVASPDGTNLDVAKTFKAARDAGLKTMGLTINPWGSEKDRRWQGPEGIAYRDYTQRTVDFVMGRLTPAQAFGKAAGGRTAYEAGELPDIAIDIWDSALRHRDAPLRERAKIARLAGRSKWVQARLATVPEAEREAALEALVTAAVALPRYFMRPDFVAFDPIHPNAEGHREIARLMCAKAPASWDCDCRRFERFAWDHRRGKLKTL